MIISSADDLTDLVKIQLNTLATLVTDDGYELICDQALSELGWSYPMTVPTKAMWLLKRASRHSLYLLLIASANKFKYKAVNLQHRFEHFSKLVADMDKEFETALTTDTALFAGVDSYRMFGTKIDAGFAYDSVGNDVTYNTDRYVNFSPLEE